MDKKFTLLANQVITNSGEIYRWNKNLQKTKNNVNKLFNKNNINGIKDCYYN